MIMPLSSGRAHEGGCAEGGRWTHADDGDSSPSIHSRRRGVRSRLGNGVKSRDGRMLDLMRRGQHRSLHIAGIGKAAPDFPSAKWIRGVGNRDANEPFGSTSRGPDIRRTYLFTSAERRGVGQVALQGFLRPVGYPAEPMAGIQLIATGTTHQHGQTIIYTDLLRREKRTRERGRIKENEKDCSRTKTREVVAVPKGVCVYMKMFRFWI